MESMYVQASIIVVATAVLLWLFKAVLDMLNYPLTIWGGFIHDHSKIIGLEEKDAWLFALLIGISRIPLIIVAAFSCVLIGYQYFNSTQLVSSLLSVTSNTFWILFVMREGCIFLGSIFFGPNMRTILRSLRS